jgi:hypothetical protein
MTLLLFGASHASRAASGGTVFWTPQEREAGAIDSGPVTKFPKFVGLAWPLIFRWGGEIVVPSPIPLSQDKPYHFLLHCFNHTSL